MESGNFQDYYAALGLQFGAADDAIKAAFRALAFSHHPDKTGNNDTTVFRAAYEAYERLMDADFRNTYDRNYWRMKLKNDPPGQRPGEQTRTEMYEVEMRQRQKMARRASPPPIKPPRKLGEPGWQYVNSAEYQNWERLSDEYYARHPECDRPFGGEPLSPGSGGMQHGLPVKMSHPCVLQSCKCRSESWQVQSGGPDHCVFCMKTYIGCSRCPGCEALACEKCLKWIAALEQKSFVLGNYTAWTA